MKFSPDKISPKPSYSCIAGKKKEVFANAVKVAISSMQSLHKCTTKFLPMRAGGEIGKNFLLAKISTYIMVQ